MLSQKRLLINRIDCETIECTIFPDIFRQHGNAPFTFSFTGKYSGDDAFSVAKRHRWGDVTKSIATQSLRTIQTQCVWCENELQWTLSVAFSHPKLNDCTRWKMEMHNYNKMCYRCLNRRSLLCKSQSRTMRICAYYVFTDTFIYFAYFMLGHIFFCCSPLGWNNFGCFVLCVRRKVSGDCRLAKYPAFWLQEFQ